MNRITRRSLVATALAATTVSRTAGAVDPIKIGMPLALTGPSARSVRR